MLRHFLTCTASFSGWFHHGLFRIGKAVGTQDTTVVGCIGWTIHSSPQPFFVQSVSAQSWALYKRCTVLSATTGSYKLEDKYLLTVCFSLCS